MNRPKPSIAALFRPQALLIAGIAILAMLAASCTRRSTDERLGRIAQYVGNQPRKALAALDSIDYPALATHDRHFYDFLRIKASDKAYVLHTSDSLVLDVIRWYEANPQYGLYPEALYYGGCVYSDLGDKPTALRYFQQALDRLPEDTEHLALRACVVSQAGLLLDNLRLYKEAIPYIKESIKIDKILNDTLNEIHDLHLLGLTEIHDSNYMEAVKTFRIALVRSKDYSKELHALSRMYLGAAKYHVGDMDSAIQLVRNTPDSLSELAQSSALAYAARIYQRAGFPDTARYYAERLIRHPYDINKDVAYQILLSPDLSGVVSPDSLPGYVRGYNDILNRYFNENKNQLALDRQNIYNYDLHEREREKAENSNMVLKTWLAASGVMIIVLAFVVLIIKIRTQRKIILLHRAIESLNRLQLITESGHEDVKDSDATQAPGYEHAGSTITECLPEDTVEKETLSMLRERLKQKLVWLQARSENIPLADSIITSSAYNALRKKIEKGVIIKDHDPLWKELENTVLKASPEFINNLRRLTLGNLSTMELRTAILIKCHIKPSEMSVLLGKSNGAIISRRQVLSEKVFDQKMSVKVIDDIIRLL